MYRELVMETYRRAEELPALWDSLAEGHPFFQRRILQNIEVSNPCCQEYVLFYRQKVPAAALISYQLSLDLLTYSRLSLPVPIRMIGIPVSVAAPGVICREGAWEDVLEYIRRLPGCTVVLNLPHELPGSDLPAGITLPDCRMDLPWNSFDEYLTALRSPYRRRLLQAMERWQNVVIDELADNRVFDQELYQLYLDVYNNSKYKLECLDIEFFRSFPSRILRFSVQGRAIAFIQLMDNGDELFFLFGGFIKEENRIYDTYLNILLEIIRQGIQGGYRSIDMGQTAEMSKTKLGCRMSRRWMYIRHRNHLINLILKKGIGFFSYREPDTSYHVFRSEGL